MLALPSSHPLFKCIEAMKTPSSKQEQDLGDQINTPSSGCESYFTNTIETRVYHIRVPVPFGRSELHRGTVKLTLMQTNTASHIESVLGDNYNTTCQF